MGNAPEVPNGLPLNRQEEDWKQLGVPLSRATLANWIIYCAENYLRHVYDYFHRQLRMRKYLMADETRVQVLNEPERNPETDSWMWLFRSGEDGLPPILLYHYTETRAKVSQHLFPTGFRYLETDGYQGYTNLPDIKRCSCWAHVRRYFTDAIPKGKEYDYSLPAVQGVQFCSKLFDCERYSKAKNHTAEQRKQFRLERRSQHWRHSELRRQQPANKGTRLAKAVTMPKSKGTLMTYLKISLQFVRFNLSENAISYSLLTGRTGCSVPVRKELPPVLLCIQWSRWQKRMGSGLCRQISDILYHSGHDKMSDE